MLDKFLCWLLGHDWGVPNNLKPTQTTTRMCNRCLKLTSIDAQ